jgi:GTPase SAR1 family protein
MGLMDYLRTFSSRNPSSSSGNGGKKGENEVRLLFLGLDNAGKTSIFKRVCNEELTVVKPTQGFQIKQLSQDGLQVMIWDVGGQKSLRGYWRNYFEAVDAVVRSQPTRVKLSFFLPRVSIRYM